MLIFWVGERKSNNVKLVFIRATMTQPLETRKKALKREMLYGSHGFI